VAAESGVERARHFRDLADEHQSKAEMYRAKAVACEKASSVRLRLLDFSTSWTEPAGAS